MTAHSLARLTVLSGGRELEGVVRDGESWAAAGRRTAGSLGGDLVPLDLSGEVKRFQIDRDVRVSLRAMTRGDLPDVVRWRSSERVRKWFDTDGEPDLASVTARYAPRIDGLAPTRNVGGGGLRPLGRLLPGLPRARLPRLRRPDS